MNNASEFYCDSHLLIAHKPAGVSTQPYFEEEMKAWVKKRFQKPGAVFLHAVHRIDRPVSGLVLFARTSKALSRLNQQMRTGVIQRRYVAEVEGEIAQEEGVLEHFLLHGDHRAYVSTEEHPEAKHARLSYRVLLRKKNTTRVMISLDTGRYHQIRVQFSAAGHPIIGDELYGGVAKKQNEISLHCEFLSLKHPTTQECITVSKIPSFC